MTRKSNFFALFICMVMPVIGSLAWMWPSHAVADEQKLLTALTVRGITYDNIETVSPSGLMKLVNAQLEQAAGEKLPIGSFVIEAVPDIPDAYNLTVEGLEWKNDDMKISIPQLEIKAIIFADADHVSEITGNMELPGFLSPFLSDKASSIQLSDIDFTNRLTFTNTVSSIETPIHIDLDLSYEQISIENIDSGRIASYADEGFSFSIRESMITPDPLDTKEILNFKSSSSRIQDFNLKRLMDFIFVPSDNPDAPFETIYTSAEIDHYHSQSDLFGSQYPIISRISRIRSTDMKLRAGKTAPANIVRRVLAMQKLKSAGELQILSLAEDAISLLEMVGAGWEYWVEDMWQKQSLPEFGSDAIMTVPLAHFKLKDSTLDYDYQGLAIATDVVNINFGSVTLKDFNYQNMLAALDAIFKNAREIMKGEQNQKNLYASFFKFIPHFANFHIEDFHLRGADGSPYQFMFGDGIRFDRISLDNHYAFEQAVLPTDFRFSIDNLTLPPQQIFALAGAVAPWTEYVLCLLDQEAPHLSLNIQAQWDRQSQTVIFPDNFLEDSITGRTSWEIALGRVPEAFFSLYPLMGKDDYQQMTFKNLDITYDSQGKDEAFFACYSKGEERTSAQIRSDLVRLLRSESPKKDNEKFDRLYQTIPAFIEKGGKLVFSTKSKTEKGIPLADFEKMDEETFFDFLDINLHTAP